MKSSDINMTNNVIGEEEYKKRISLLFDDVADKLSKTLGPFGATTFLDKVGDVMVSKDGWQVLKKLAYMDEVQNTLLGLLIKIAHQVVMRVGDGSTTSIVGADQLLKQIDLISAETKMRPKQLLDTLEYIVEDICVAIQNNAIEIDKQGDLEEIYKLAMVSTNGDKEISEMIRTIYKETGNPAIEFNKSKSSETTFEVLKGYKLQFMTYIDRIFINNDNGTCKITRPKILMFNHKLEQEYFESILQPAIGAAIRENKRLVVIAPYYDSFLLQKFSRELAYEFKATKTTNVVYTRGSLMDTHREELYNDFAALCGCTVINENIVHEIATKELEFKPEEYLGEVEEMEIGEQSTFATGFICKNEGMLEILEKDAISKYQELAEASESASTITEALVQAKQRMSKLKCNMGVINVGGSTELAKLANFDLVEDAVKACESAFLFGVTPGQTLGIQTAVKQLKESGRYNEKEVLFLDAISEAYKGVTRILLENKFKQEIPESILNRLLKYSIDKQAVIDLEQTEIDFENKEIHILDIEMGRLEKWYREKILGQELPLYEELVVPQLTDVELNENIINSCKTDIEILRATSGIVGLLLSSNQYVAVRF